MTLQEVSRYLHMEIRELQKYEENGLLRGTRTTDGHVEYSEKDLQRIVHLHSLQQAGMNMENLKRYALLLQDGKDTEMAQIRILRKCRYQLLEEIHGKQQLLDRLDYLIQEKRNKKGGTLL